MSDVAGFNLGALMIDEGVSRKGVWVDYVGGSKLLLASTHGPEYKAKIASLYRQHRLRLDDSNPDNVKVIADLTSEALAETILLGWSGIHWPRPDGTVERDVPYTKALGLEALKKADAFREFVIETAGRTALFQEQAVQEAVGN